MQLAVGSSGSRRVGDVDMDYRFDRIQSHLEGCLRQAGVFERTVEGSQLFDVDIIERAGAKWVTGHGGRGRRDGKRWSLKRATIER
jgi:hypothetical protein